jgi:hypothetical protein
MVCLEGTDFGDGVRLLYSVAAAISLTVSLSPLPLYSAAFEIRTQGGNCTAISSPTA